MHMVTTPVPQIIILIHYVLKHSLYDNKLSMVQEKRLSSRYPEQKLSDLEFADKKATDEVAAEGAKAGPIINVKKTKVLHVKNTPEDIIKFRNISFSFTLCHIFNISYNNDRKPIAIIRLSLVYNIHIKT